MAASLDFSLSKNILTQLNNPLMVLSRHGKILALNPAAQRLFALSPDQIIDQNYFDFCEHHEIKSTLKSVKDLENIDTNTPVETKNNFKTVQWQAIQDENHPNALIFFGTDITSWINNSEKSTEVQNSIIDYFPEHCIFWKDSNSVFLGCNNAFVKSLGFSSKSEIIGKTDHELPTSPEETQKFRLEDQEVMRSRQAKLNIEEQQTLPNGEKRILSTTKVPLLDPRGQAYGILGIYKDITESKRIEHDLKQAKEAAEAGERSKTEFIANVSHDMRTPLSGLIGLAHILEDEVTEAECKLYAAQLAESGDELLEMFIEILDDVAADHMTEKDIDQETFDIYQFAEKLGKLKKPSITQKKLDYLCTIDPRIPRFLISDRRKIHRIMLNLLGNAIKFTKSGHVKLTIDFLGQEQDCVKLKFSVIDTGIGISEKDKLRLFERFYKAYPSYKSEYKGFGIGLHIAQSYTDLLGGNICFTSTEGLGSTFNLVLNLKIANEQEINCHEKTLVDKPSALKMNSELKSQTKTEFDAAIPTSSTQIKMQNADKTPKILVIEDNLLIRRITVKLLNKYQLNVVDAEDGKPALDLVKNQEFDLVLCDLGLPQMSGIEFTQQLRLYEKDHQQPPLPVIAVTAHTVRGRNECLKAGMNAIVPKPLTPELISEILANFLPNFNYSMMA